MRQFSKRGPRTNRSEQKTCLYWQGKPKSETRLPEKAKFSEYLEVQIQKFMTRLDQRLQNWIARIHQLNEWMGNSISWLTFALVLLVVVDVVYRRALHDTQTWIMELEWHLFALIFLISAGYAFLHDRHVRVDLFYTRFSEKEKALVDLVGGVLFLLPWCAMIIFFGFHFSKDAFLLGEGSPDPGGLPARFLIKFSMVVGAFLLMLQGIASIFKAILVLRGHYTGMDEEEFTESL
jgi:TRAP-type mannitol/chloroaromatic compound transport system permease small subunit